MDGGGVTEDEGPPEEEDFALIIARSSRFDDLRRRDGRLRVGHPERDGGRRRDLHLRAVQRQEPLGRRPRRERQGGRMEEAVLPMGKSL